MGFQIDPEAYITALELSNRDQTYLIVRFKAKKNEQGLVFGKASSSGGTHAEQYLDAWCRNPGNKETLQGCFKNGGPYMEIFLTKSPCGKDAKDCADTIIKLATFLNGPTFAMQQMFLVILGMHKGVHDQYSQDAMKRLMCAQPLIEMYPWDVEESDPFDRTDNVLQTNLQRKEKGSVYFYDNSANKRRGTDVGTRTTLLSKYMMEGLGYRNPMKDEDSDDEDGMAT